MADVLLFYSGVRVPLRHCATMLLWKLRMCFLYPSILWMFVINIIMMMMVMIILIGGSSCVPFLSLSSWKSLRHLSFL